MKIKYDKILGSMRESDEPISNVVNIENGLRVWRSAVAKLQSGQDIKPVINVYGTSIAEGGISTDYHNKGWVGLIRSKLASTFGNVGTGFLRPEYPLDNSLEDFQLGFVGSWVQIASGKISTTNGDTFSLKFLGTGITILAQQYSDYGSISVVVDGGTPVVFDFDGETDYCKNYDITGLTDGEHTLTATVNSATGKTVKIHGALPLIGDAGVLVNNFGSWGAKATYYIPNALLDITAKKYFIDYWMPKLSIIALMGNDVSGNSDPTEYRAAVQNLITACKDHGDVLLIASGLREATGMYPSSVYSTILRGLASNNNCAFVDVDARWGNNFAVADDVYNFYSADNVHLNDTGHQDFANAILNVLGV